MKFPKTAEIYKKPAFIIAAIMIAAIGTYLLKGSHASSPYASITADKGTLANGATVKPCPGASDNNTCVVFGAASTSQPKTIVGLVGVPSYLGAQTAALIFNAGIQWTRIEDGTTPTVADATAVNFKIDLIVGNTDDNTPLKQINVPSWTSSTLAQIEKYQSNPNVQLYEIGNETYLKGGSADPASYGKMYLSLYNAVKNAESNGDLTHNVKLLFNMYGNYKTVSGFPSCSLGESGCSADGANGGWLRDAVNANPGLAQAIIATAFAAHPYGLPNQNNGDDYNTGAVAGEENVSQAVLGTIPDFYLTETGFSIHHCTANGCSQPDVPDQATQASMITQTYDIFLADPHVKGVWLFSINDNGTGNFGVFNGPNSPRPSFTALAQEAQKAQ